MGMNSDYVLRPFKKAYRNLVEGLTRNSSNNLFENRPHTIGMEDLNVFTISLYDKTTRKMAARVFNNPHGLKESDKRLT